MQAKDGFAMGSPTSPGWAGLYAACKEGEALREIDWVDRRILPGDFMARRWMDDTTRVLDKKLTRGCKRITEPSRRTKAYGDRLQLLRTHGGDAFSKGQKGLRRPRNSTAGRRSGRSTAGDKSARGSKDAGFSRATPFSLWTRELRSEHR